MRSPGFVYVMVNPHSPQFVRVGRTDRPPEDTAQESNLQLRDAAYFSDALSAEGFVHDYLETFHTSQDPELFEVPIEIALKALSLAMERHVGTRANLPVNPSLYDDEPTAVDGTTAATLFERGAQYRVEGDAANALKYLKRAARLAEPRAFLALAEMTERGEGTRADESRAAEWLNEGTRAGVRECWGALADRYPQTKYLRPYFQGAEFGLLTPEQRQVAIRRMRVYLQLAAARLEPDDERVIPLAIEQLHDRDLEREWQRVERKSGFNQSGGKLKWIVALGLVALLAVALPMLLRKFKPAPPATTTAEATPAAADDAADKNSATPKAGKARGKGASAARPSGLRDAAPVAEAPVAKPVINDGSKPAEAPVQAEAQTWVTRTPPPVQAAAPREITAEELREQFNWSKEKAAAAFKDSVVKITEKVLKVGKHDITFKKIKCKINGEPPARVEPGMTITVEGTVQGKGFWTGTIALENCRVLPD